MVRINKLIIIRKVNKLITSTLTDYQSIVFLWTLETVICFSLSLSLSLQNHYSVPGISATQQHVTEPLTRFSCDFKQKVRSILFCSHTLFCLRFLVDGMGLCCLSLST